MSTEADQVTTTTTTLGDATVAEFRAELRGEVIVPGDANYEARRAIWNGMIDRHPAVIARCRDTADVIASVQLARSNDLPLAVRGGGHNVAGNAVCDDGLVIDLSLMSAVHVDPARRTARVQGGATLGDLDHATRPYGLAAITGMVSMTGVGGLTLGGGLGWLQRKYGLACDNIVSAEVVTANGQVITASETENSDLLWGLRGGGGNFGVVTSLELRLFPVTTVYAGFLIYPMQQAAEALRFYEEFCRTCPDELTTLAAILTVPPEEFVPEDLREKLGLFIMVSHCGEMEAAEESLRPLRAFGQPEVDMIGPMPHFELQRMYDAGYPAGNRWYWKSDYVRALDEATIETLVAQAATRSTPLCEIDIHDMGGAVSRVAADATAFGHRDAPFLINTIGGCIESHDDAATIAWVREVSAALAPISTGAYVNFLSPSDVTGARLAYESGTYERLAALKAKYDPTNVFRLNHNIPPRS